MSIGLLLVILAVWQIYMAQAGLDVISLHSQNPPVTVIAPSEAVPGSRPTILIAHGFAGSAVLMRGFALTLAHAGYTTVSWDFEGHGANPNPLELSSESANLLKDAESALELAKTTGLVDSQHIAILGHSMGSGVAVNYGTVHPDTYATIAVSPVSQSVSNSLPHNLLLMAGSLEPEFAVSAQELLAQAGGEGGSLTAGTARKLVIIPSVEHISILFSPAAHSTSRDWLDGTFGVQPGAASYTDLRMLWLIVGIVGTILICSALLRLIPVINGVINKASPLWLRLIALLGGSLLATLILWLVSLAGIKVGQLFGILVGGYLLIWFALAGVISLIILRPRISMPMRNEWIKAAITFAALWLGVGLLGNYVWLPWLLIPERLRLWIPGAIILIPWFLAVGESARQAKPLGMLGWWLFQTVAVIAGFYLAIRINPDLGFIFIILPLIPIMFGLHILMITPRHGSWAYAIPGAMFTAWLLLAVFPLQ